MSGGITLRQPIPLRYPGGKFYALDILRPFWTAVDHDEYREPFAGGATVFFNKYKVPHNWLNDVDRELITTYRVMSEKTLRNRLVEMLQTEVASKERWKEVYSFVPSSDLVSR